MAFVVEAIDKKEKNLQSGLIVYISYVT